MAIPIFTSLQELSNLPVVVQLVIRCPRAWIWLVLGQGKKALNAVKMALRALIKSNKNPQT